MLQGQHFPCCQCLDQLLPHLCQKQGCSTVGGGGSLLQGSMLDPWQHFQVGAERSSRERLPTSIEAALRRQQLSEL